jgi:hypothetical protein
MMLAVWVWAVIFWIEGLNHRQPRYLLVSSVLIVVASVTKYFGMSLVFLLAAYSLIKHRRFSSWALYLLIPVAALVGYQVWTANLYGHGLLTGAAEYAKKRRAMPGRSPLGKALLALSYGGGCVLSGLVFAPLIWSRKHRLGAILLSVLAGLAISLSWVAIGNHAGGHSVTADGQYGVLITTQVILCVAGGISVLALALAVFWEDHAADVLLLAMWIFGTFFFAGFVNWTINVRSVLPVIPAACILLARRLDRALTPSSRPTVAKVAVALLLCGFVSVWLAQADAELANSARRAVTLIGDKTRNRGGLLWFSGHWGFQYYMELTGARPVDWDHPELRGGDFVVIPFNNANIKIVNPEFVASQDMIAVPIRSWAGTISPELGAGFYSSYWGPLPYAIGPVAPERYWIAQVARTITSALGATRTQN